MRALLIAAALLAFASPAVGQQQKQRAAQPAPPPPLTGNIVRDIGNLRGGSDGGSSSGGDPALAAIAKPLQALANFIGDSIDEGIALSTSIPELQDGNGQQCWLAMKSASKVFKAHPVPLTLKVIPDFEALRLVAMAANKLCMNVNCTVVFADGTAMANAASPVPLVIPSLHDLCSKIPQIAVVSPVPVPPDLAPVTPATPVPTAPQQ